MEIYRDGKAISLDKPCSIDTSSSKKFVYVRHDITGTPGNWTIGIEYKFTKDEYMGLLGKILEIDKDDKDLSKFFE